MEEWKEYNILDAPLVPLTDLVEFIVDNRGKTVPTAAIGIKLIATNCIRNEYLYPLYEKVRYVSEEIYNTWFRSHPKPGDIIFVNKGTPGKCALVPDPVDFCIAQDMMAFRLKSDLVYNKYLLAILRSRELQYFIMNNQVGTIIPHFKKEQLKTLMIPLPEMRIQKRIGDLYFNFSEKVEINRRINENLEQQAQALFKSWFVDFEPFRDGEFVESELGMIPKGWRVVAFKDFIVSTTDKVPVGSLPEYSVTNNGIIPRDAKFNKKLSKETSKNKVLRKDNLVFGMSREILNWGIMEDEIGGVSSAYNVYKINKGIIDPVYLRLYMTARISDFNSLIGTAAREGQSLDKGALMQKIVYIPSKEVLKSFFRIYYSIIDVQKEAQQESHRLATLRDTLLPKLMSGELKVNDIN